MVKAYDFGTPTRYFEERISNFKGVDLTSVESEVDKNRSPDSINMVASLNGLIEKRGGFKLHKQTSKTGEFKNFYRFHMVAKGNHMGTYYQHEIDIDFIHVGTTIYWSVYSPYEGYFWSEIFNEGSFTSYLRTLDMVDPSECNDVYYAPLGIENLGDTILQKIYFFGNGIDSIISVNCFLPTGEVYVTADDVIRHAYIPTTVIASDPQGGGESFEDISYLTWCRKNSFLGTAGTTQYKLADKNLMAVNSRYSTPQNGTVKAEILQTDGTWSTITEGFGLTVNRTTGVVTFSVAPGESPVTGMDNVIITYAKNNWSGCFGIRDNIAGTDTFYGSIFSLTSNYALFGTNGQSTYLFVAFENIDRYINLDTLYSPQLSYSYIGSNKTRIKGYTNMGSYLLIHKEESDEEPTIYLRSISIDADDNVIFPLSNGSKGIGAIAKKSFQYLRGVPLFLADDGIYMVESTDIMYEQNVSNVSHYISNEIKNIPKYALEKAMSITYDGKYMLVVNSYLTYPTRIYVADSKQISQNRDAKGRMQYEWYVWEVPFDIDHLVTVPDFVLGKDDLFFCLTNGIILKYDDGVHFDYLTVSTTQPVAAHWTTPVTFFSDSTHKKSLKNVWIKLKRYFVSGVSVSYKVGNEVKDIGYKGITNVTDSTPEVVVTNRVEKQFMSIQLIFKNDKSEPFGLIEIVSKFKYNAEYKGG